LRTHKANEHDRRDCAREQRHHDVAARFYRERDHAHAACLFPPGGAAPMLGLKSPVAMSAVPARAPARLAAPHALDGGVDAHGKAAC
jgi:hypothetical protein